MNRSEKAAGVFGASQRSVAQARVDASPSSLCMLADLNDSAHGVAVQC